MMNPENRDEKDLNGEKTERKIRRERRKGELSRVEEGDVCKKKK